MSLESIIAVDRMARPLSTPLPVIEPGTTWVGALFGYEDPALKTGVWLSELSGWTLKFRATYENARESETLAVMGDLARGARVSAAARLTACAASPIPERPGTRIVDAVRIAEVIAEAAIDMAGNTQAQTWCVEKLITDGAATLMFWRDAADAHDRVSLMTVDAPLIFASFSQNNSVYRLEVPFDGKRVLFGFFDGRPSADTLLPLVREIIAGTVDPVAVYDPQTSVMEVTR
jgi:hypothetical protein